MIIVQACEFIYTGDGMHRVHEPARFLGKLPGVTCIDCHTCHPSFLPLAQLADVLILPFFQGWDLLRLIEDRRAAGKVTIFETDDYYHEPQAWNPIARYWGNPTVRAHHQALIAAADGVQTSTLELQSTWESTAKEIAVFKNHISELPQLSDVESDNEFFTVGWAGSQGHLADWYHLVGPLQEWMADKPDVRLAVMSHYKAREFVHLPKERFVFKQAGTLKEYFEFLPQLDVGFAPLLDSKWNRSRSDVKFLEYAAHGVVGIYSDLGPYNSSVVHESTGFLASSVTEMVDQVDKLYRDRGQLSSVRDLAYHYVKTERQLPDRIGERFDFYQSFDPPRTDLGVIPQHLLTDGVSEAGYIRIDRDTDTQIVYDALEGKSTKGLIETANRRPEYYLAQRITGQKLRESGKIGEALHYLNRSLELYPNSSAALFDKVICIADSRSYADAFPLIVKALERNPYSDAAWKLGANLALNLNDTARQKLLNLKATLQPNNYVVHSMLVGLAPPDLRLRYLTDFLRLVESAPEHEKPAVARLTAQVLTLHLPEFLMSKDTEVVLTKAEHLFPKNVTILLMSARYCMLHQDTKGLKSYLARAAELKRVLECNAPKGNEFDIEYFMPEIVMGGREER